jgi:hypothetical protein
LFFKQVFLLAFVSLACAQEAAIIQEAALIQDNNEETIVAGNQVRAAPPILDKNPTTAFTVDRFSH